jgi:hypothetical protein
MITGHYFDGMRSQRTQAAMYRMGNLVSVQIEQSGENDTDTSRMLPAPVPLAEMLISSRLGSATRSLRFPGGQLFQTQDNDTIDAWLDAEGLALPPTLVHRLESHSFVVAASLLG